MGIDPIYSEQASEQLDRIEADPALVKLWNAICDALELICDAPESAEARREALRTATGEHLWRVPVRYFDDDRDWCVLWQQRGSDALIAYVGWL